MFSPVGVQVSLFGKKLKINPVSIANNTSGISKSAGGYVWKNK